MNLHIFIVYKNYTIMITESLKEKLGSFMAKNPNNLVEHGQNEEGQQVCDLDTGICYVIKSRDGLIERVENTIRVNRKVQVESPSGQLKQLLNG